MAYVIYNNIAIWLLFLLFLFITCTTTFVFLLPNWTTSIMDVISVCGVVIMGFALVWVPFILDFVVSLSSIFHSNQKPINFMLIGTCVISCRLQITRKNYYLQYKFVCICMYVCMCVSNVSMYLYFTQWHTSILSVLRVYSHFRHARTNSSKKAHTTIWSFSGEISFSVLLATAKCEQHLLFSYVIVYILDILLIAKI